MKPQPIQERARWILAPERALWILANVKKAQARDKDAMENVLKLEEIKRLVNSYCNNQHRSLPYDKSVEDLLNKVLSIIYKELPLVRADSAEQFFAWVRAVIKSKYYDEFRKADPLNRGKRVEPPEVQERESDSTLHQRAFVTQARQLEDMIEAEEIALFELRKKLLPEALSKLSVPDREGVTARAHGDCLARVAKLMGLNHPEQARRRLSVIYAKLNRILLELEKGRRDPSG
jgi:DNA-directed RNA polymerase specialized sigma24 family protein